MSTSLKVILLTIGMSVATGALAIGQYYQRPSTPASDNGSWPLLGRTSDIKHNSPLAQINDKTVQKLGLAWSADMPSPDGLTGNPLVVDGVVYQSGPAGRVFANDVRTGKALWTFAAEIDYEGASMASYWALTYNRGLAVLDDKVIVAVGDCRLIALDRKTGTKVWESVSCDRTHMYGITGAPRVGGGMVFIGNSCIDSGLERGFVDAFDGKTGARKWRFYTVPEDPAKGQDSKVMEMAAKTWGTDWYKKTHGCGSVWEGITYDAQLNQVYIGTGGPSPFNPMDRARDAGDELFTNAIVALKADTGEYVWHYTTTPHDGWNYEATMQTMIADLPLNGKTRRVVMQAPKNGFFYVLDAKTGEFISAQNITPVNWASGIDQKTGRPVFNTDARYWEKADKKAVVLPSPLGAHNWHAMAFNEKTGLIYIPVMSMPTSIELNNDFLAGGILMDFYYGTSAKDPNWQPYGELVAWDPVEQKARWRIKRTMPINGGTLTTAGNLVFQGTADGHFDAFAADTGKLLWSYDVGSTIQAAPTTIEVDGEQVVLVASGKPSSAVIGTYLARYSSTPKSRGQSRLLAFKIGGTAKIPADALELFKRPTAPRPTPELAHRGKLVYETSFCADCHGLAGETSGGTIPDLRRTSTQNPKRFEGVVVRGIMKDTGMPTFKDIAQEDVQAMQAFLINEAWNAYEAQEQGKPAPDLTGTE